MINVLLQFRKTCLEIEIRIISKECHIWECFEEKEFGEFFVGILFDFLFLCGGGLSKKIRCMGCCTYHA
jgi:hypothetical protein